MAALGLSGAAWTAIGITSAVSAASTATATAVSANQQRIAARKQADAQKEAQRKQQVAQEQEAREAQARQAAELRQRDFATDSANTRLRGIQATMLASRKASSNEGGKTKLGE